jgi:hypothetical protein
MKNNLSILFKPNVITCYCTFYNLILDGQDVDVNALMLQLEQEVQHDFNVTRARKRHGNMSNSWNMGYEPPLEGTKISRSNQRLLLKTYLGNKKAWYWIKLSSWTPLKLYLNYHNQ